MNLSAEEKMMYEVMKAIYDSGIPISFKGSMVMKACLMEAGYTEDTRHTVDIDGNWNSDTPPSGDQMVASIRQALDGNGIPLTVSIYRMYGEERSAGFELKNSSTDEIIFTMDLDVNRPMIPTRIYELQGIRFCGSALKQMLADKVSVISTDKIFRRIKDVVDLYYYSQVFTLEREEILQTLNDSGRRMGDFDGFINRVEELKHSYEKFRFSGGINKPAFEDVYQGVKAFIAELIG